MKKTILIFLSMVSSLLVSAQLLTENFNYTTNDSLSANSWTIASGSTTNALRATDTALIYTGYPASATGKSVPLNTNGQDLVRDLSISASNNSVYASFLVRANSAQSTGDYFFGFLPQGSTTAFTGRTFIRLSSSGYYRVGVSKGSVGANETLTYSNDSFVIGQTYLYVLKYSIIPGTTNDSIKLFVLSSGVPSQEPSNPTTFTLGGANADVATISRIFIRQGSATAASTLNIGGVRVNTLWDNTALPVELIQFSVKKFDTKNMLSWSTAWELNNRGFEVQRSTDGENFETIDFVKGYGNSNSVKTYVYFDNQPNEINYYRLKQVDFDGQFEYSKMVVVKSDFQNINVYPNPFSQEITVDFENVKEVIIYNLDGNYVQTSKNRIDTHELPTGFYLIKITDQSGNIVVKKIVKK